MKDDENYWDFDKAFDKSPNKERMSDADTITAQKMVFRLSKVKNDDIIGKKIVEKAFYKKVQFRFHYYKKDKTKRQQLSRRRERKAAVNYSYL